MTNKISEITGNIHTNDEARLFFRHCRTEKERAGVLIVHGLGEHSGRYDRLMENLAENGIRSFAYDHRGHGRSSGKRGHVRRFRKYLDDLEIMVEKSRETFSSGIPLFLLGHSMGGLIALNYAQQKNGKIDGIAVSSPALEPAARPAKAVVLAVRALSVLVPSFSLDNGLDPQFLSHDRKIVDGYLADQLVHRKITAQWAVEFIRAGEQTRHNGHLLELPVLMQVAGRDRLVSPEASRGFFETICAYDKTLRFYESMYHEIYNETEAFRKQAVEDLVKWINEHAS